MAASGIDRSRGQRRAPACEAACEGVVSARGTTARRLSGPGRWFVHRLARPPTAAGCGVQGCARFAQPHTKEPPCHPKTAGCSPAWTPWSSWPPTATGSPWPPGADASGAGGPRVRAGPPRRGGAAAGRRRRGRAAAGPRRPPGGDQPARRLGPDRPGPACRPGLRRLVPASDVYWLADLRSRVTLHAAARLPIGHYGSSAAAITERPGRRRLTGSSAGGWYLQQEVQATQAGRGCRRSGHATSGPRGPSHPAGGPRPPP
jgi:hypothetical protein